MGGSETIAIDAASAASLLEWWLEAGVDGAIGESPRDWLKPLLAPAPLVPSSPALAGAPASATAAPTTWPTTPTDATTLAAFHAWLGIASGLPLERPGARRIVPAGNEGAPLMLLADLPDPGGDAIGGDAWLLATRMLGAIGIDPAAAYVAALTCFAAPGAKIARDVLERCGAIARDHVRLARPERLLLFGDAPARALTGQPLTSARGKVHRVEGVRTVATFHPRWLLQRPSDKALAWRDLLLLMSEEG